jgi:hypothetical protein
MTYSEIPLTLDFTAFYVAICTHFNLIRKIFPFIAKFVRGAWRRRPDGKA